MTLASDLNDIADRLQRLAPSHRHPERYFEEKSQLVYELRRLAANNQKRRGAALPPQPARQAGTPSPIVPRRIGGGGSVGASSTACGPICGPTTVTGGMARQSFAARSRPAPGTYLPKIVEDQRAVQNLRRFRVSLICKGRNDREWV